MIGAAAAFGDVGVYDQRAISGHVADDRQAVPSATAAQIDRSAIGEPASCIDDRGPAGAHDIAIVRERAVDGDDGITIGKVDQPVIDEIARNIERVALA